MTVYNKLVRDRIPELIRMQGQEPQLRILDDQEYALQLEKKLEEEVNEFQRDKNLEELADILEVLYALTENLGYSGDDLHRVCLEKRSQRGAFRERIFLVSKKDKCL
jgi:predicted house-cleaning noncanonical NTP pyrophosphatase (MazG superfamily)